MRARQDKAGQGGEGGWAGLSRRSETTRFLGKTVWTSSSTHLAPGLLPERRRDRQKVHGPRREMKAALSPSLSPLAPPKVSRVWPSLLENPAQPPSPPTLFQ